MALLGVGVEFPGQMPRAAGAVLAGKAQEGIQTRPGSRWASVAPPEPGDKQEKGPDQDSVQWCGGGGDGGL